MTTLLTRLGNYFKLGKGRYFIGKDLEANKYYEFPSLDGSTDPRKSRRIVQYREHKELGEHDQGALPIQWLMWLRHTRRSAPTIQELQDDKERIRITQHNVRILEARDAERRLQLESRAAEQSQRMRIEADRPRPGPAVASGSNTASRDPRRTTVPTSHVSDKEADAESKDRVSEEQQLDETTIYQQRKIDMEVWEASRRRIESQDRSRQEALASTSAQDSEAGSLQEAQGRRSARRAEMQKKDEERERARRVMSQSPLNAFDVTYGSSAEQPQQQKATPAPRPAAPRPSTPPPRHGRPTGPDEGWSPQTWQPRPRER